MEPSSRVVHDIVSTCVKSVNGPPGTSLPSTITKQQRRPSTGSNFTTITTASAAPPPQASLAVRHLRHFQLRPQRLQSGWVNKLRRLHYLRSTLIHLTPKQNLILYHFRIVLRLHVKHRPHNRASPLDIHVHVRDIDAPSLKRGRHAPESSDEVFWRLIMLKVRCGGDEVQVAEAEDGIGCEETEDVVVVWVVVADRLRAGGGYPV
jgi:hypothetical protein